MVKVPPAMILLPTWVIALTEPFMTCGVNVRRIRGDDPRPVVGVDRGCRRCRDRQSGDQRARCSQGDQSPTCRYPTRHVDPPHAGAPSLCSTAPTRPHDSMQPRGTLREALTTPTDRWRLHFGQSRVRTLRDRNVDSSSCGQSRTVMVIRSVGRPWDWSALTDRPRTLEATPAAQRTRGCVLSRRPSPGARAEPDRHPRRPARPPSADAAIAAVIDAARTGDRARRRRDGPGGGAPVRPRRRIAAAAPQAAGASGAGRHGDRARGRGAWRPPCADLLPGDAVAELPGLGDAAARAAQPAQRHRRPPARRAAPAGPPRRTSAARGPLQVVVAPVRSLLQPMVAGLGDLEPVAVARRRRGRPRRRARRLAAAAYARVDLVEKRGDFAVRGGIVDVFPPTEEHPLRRRVLGRHGRGGPLLQGRRPAQPRDRRRRPVGAAVPRAAAHRRGARPGRASWPPSIPGWPTCSTSSPRASPSRAWSHWRRCSSTRWCCCSTRCPPAPTSSSAIRSASAPAPTTCSRPARSSSRRPGPTRPPAAKTPLDLGAAAYRSLADVRATALAARACRGGRSPRSSLDRPESTGRRSTDDDRAVGDRRAWSTPAPSTATAATPRGRSATSRAGSATAGASCWSPRATARPSGWSRCCGGEDIAGPPRRHPRRDARRPASCT